MARKKATNRGSGSATPIEATASMIKISLYTPGIGGRWGLPLLFWGDPGVAKSKVIEGLAHELGLFCHTMVASIRSPEDFSGLPVPVKRGRNSFVEYAPAAWAADIEIEHDGHAVIFVDELTTCAPAVQAALLRMILDGALGDYKLPKRVRFIAAANDVKDAAGGWDLAAPLANRFGHHNWTPPDVSDWGEYMMGLLALNGGGDEDPNHATAVSLEKQVMQRWPDAFAKAVGITTAFTKARAGLLHAMPEVGNANRTRAWPSHRTWEMATRALAGSDVHGADDITKINLLSAYIGAGAAGELTTFLSKADLPDPADVLDGKVKFKHEPRRLDRSVAVLNGAAALLSSPHCKNVAPRSERMWQIMGTVMEDAADIAVQPGRTLVRARRHLNCQAAEKPLEALHPVLQAAGIRP